MDQAIVVDTFVGLGKYAFCRVVLEEVNPFLDDRCQQLVTEAITQPHHPVHLLIDVRGAEQNKLERSLRRELLIQETVHSLLNFFIGTTQGLTHETKACTVVIHKEDMIVFVIGQDRNNPGSSQVLRDQRFFEFLFDGYDHSTLSNHDFRFFGRPLLTRPSGATTNGTPSIPMK
ncbi:Uncharacterised protein [Vibrio cholerae]|uniref:Uncharacterized protein n=1 Tax=Vibrio cholerae TaxID=666 RepID=A0A656AZ41_VIBCL|nr:Uncharacterised protein [Vibrio cholerae]